MKHFYIILLFLFAACKNNTTGQDAKKDTPVIKIKDTVIKTSIAATTYQQFFDKQFDLGDSFSTQIDSGIIAGSKIIIVAARDTTFSFARIVVLKRENSQLQLLDSSGMMDADGRGPHITLNDDTLVINHGFHRGYNAISYTFDKQMNKFKFFEITNYVIEPAGDNESLGVEIYQTYNELSHQLHVRTELRDYKRFKKLIGSRQKDFTRSNHKLWLRDLTGVQMFGDEEIFTVDDKELAELSNYKKSGN